MKGRSLLLLLGSLTVSVCFSIDQFDENLQSNLLNDFSDYDAMDKRSGKWQMRMFKRGGEEAEEDIVEETEDEHFHGLDKRDPWKKMSMFKKEQPWKMRMFKRYPYFDKKSPWKMRMFKRMPTGFGKRPDKWQMRMFKRDPEANK